MDWSMQQVHLLQGKGLQLLHLLVGVQSTQLTACVCVSPLVLFVAHCVLQAGDV